MKVMLINTCYAPHGLGGAERSVQLLAEGIASRGHETIVLATSPSGHAEAAKLNAVQVHYLAQRNIYTWPPGSRNPVARMVWHAIDTWNPVIAGDVERILIRERPDLIHTNNLGGFSGAVWRTARKRRIPVLHTIRDYYLLCPNAIMFRRGRNCEQPCVRCRLYSGPRRCMSDDVNVVVGVSRHVLKAHLTRGFFGKARASAVVPNSCGATPSDAPLKDASPGERLRVGFLGSLYPAKGVEHLLRVARRLPAERYEFVVAGKGKNEYEAALRERFGAANVTFPGHVEPQSFFPGIDLLVVPSLLHESFGRVVIEAFARGIPVIGSRRGGIPELIEEGVTGHLFDPDVEDALERKLLNLDHRSCRRMRSACIAASRAFTDKNVVEQYLNLYARLCTA